MPIYSMYTYLRHEENLAFKAVQYVVISTQDFKTTLEAEKQIFLWILLLKAEKKPI